jgi:hypothetical protein
MRAAHVKCASLVYAGFFMIVGQQFNQYWGWLTAPLWTIAYALGTTAIVALSRNATERKKEEE